MDLLLSGRTALVTGASAGMRTVSLTLRPTSGLSSGNVAKIGEIGTLIRVAALQPIIADTSVLPQVEIKNKRYKVLLDNTNKMLLADFDEIKFSKTGFTSASGWSVGMILERQGQRFVVVVLGAKNKAERYELARKMVHKHFADIEHTVALEQENVGFWRRIVERIFGK